MVDWRLAGEFNQEARMTNLDVSPNMKLRLTKEPVTRVACATSAPESIGSLTWCYV
jgi:hypothetical protein